MTKKVHVVNVHDEDEFPSAQHVYERKEDAHKVAERHMRIATASSNEPIEKYAMGGAEDTTNYYHPSGRSAVVQTKEIKSFAFSPRKGK